MTDYKPPSIARPSNAISRKDASTMVVEAMKAFSITGEKRVRSYDNDDTVSMDVRLKFGVSVNVDVNFGVDYDFEPKYPTADFYPVTAEVSVNYGAGRKDLMSAVSFAALLQSMTTFGVMLHALLDDRPIILDKN